METTYQEMTLEHLGDNANVADLAAFQRACKIRSRADGETADESTAWMWGQGDFFKRVLEYVDYDPDAAEKLAPDDLADLADNITQGNYDL